MSMAILGLGTSLPPHCVSQAEAARLAERLVAGGNGKTSAISALYRRAGVKTRHTVLPRGVYAHDWSCSAHGSDDRSRLGPTTEQRMAVYEQEAHPLALRAAKSALHNAQLPASAITHIVTVSCTGFAAPGVDIELIKKLGLARTVQRTHIGFMGCHGAVNGLRVAAALAAADSTTRLLLCAVEVCSVHYHYGADPKRLIGNALFSDGAAALVGGPWEPGATNWRVSATGSCLLPESEELMSWVIRDHGFEMVLSPRVPSVIREHLRPWLEDWLESQGVTLRGVRSWAIHPGGPRILDAVEQSLGLTKDDTTSSRQVLSSCGNMSSPTLLFILEHLRQAQAARPCVAIGFGPGLVAEAALLL